MREAVRFTNSSIKQLRQALGIVPHDAVFREQVVENAAQAHALQLAGLGGKRLGAAQAIPPRDRFGHRLPVDDHPVDDLVARVMKDDANVIGERQPLRLSRLRHQVGDVNPRGAGFRDGFRYAFHQQIRNDAGVQRAWTQNDYVRLGDRVQHFGQRADAARHEFEPPHDLLRFRDARLAVDDRAVLHAPLSSETFSIVLGKILPRMARTCALSRTASGEIAGDVA